MTLEEKLIAYEMRQGHEPQWVRQTDVRAAFYAGAAAMAELFANGQALKMEQSPRCYKVTWGLQEGKAGSKTVEEIVHAYTAREAVEFIIGRKGAMHGVAFYGVRSVEAAI